MAKVSLAAVIPDGREYKDDVDLGGATSDLTIRHFCLDAVSKLGLTTSRDKPEKIKVRVCRLELVKGEVIGRSIGTYDIQPPFPQMDRAEYEQRVNAAVSELPTEFREFVKDQAYDRGHGSGFDECLGIAEGLVDDLIPVVNKHRENIVRELDRR